MSKNLPLIDIFTSNAPITIQDKMETTQESPQSKANSTLKDYQQAILYALETFSTREMEIFITDALKIKQQEFKQWHSCMPPLTPQALSEYKNSYRKCDFPKVDEETNNIGYKLSKGQRLIHGGLWRDLSAKIPTDRPLSTTFCPQVAITETFHCGKAYDNDRIDIIILTVINPKTNVYVFNQSQGKPKHEREVLFASGATLTKKNEIQIEEKYLVYKYDTNLGELKKTVPVYIIEADIS